MSDVSGDYRGGDIELSAQRPRGLPFAKPLYGLPPYQYTDDIVLMIVYEAEEAAIREVLPRQLEPMPGNIVAMCFFLCPEVTGIGPHNFTMPCIPVRYGDYTGQFVPYLYTSTDASLACYREGQGWPAVLGQTEIVEAQGTVRAPGRARRARNHEGNGESRRRPHHVPRLPPYHPLQRDPKLGRQELRRCVLCNVNIAPDKS